MAAFRLVYSLGAISYFILIFFPDSENMTYLASVLMVTSVGGWDNIGLLIMELRVPPTNVAAVSLMIRTMAVSSGIFAPTVAALPAPMPYCLMLFVATCGLFATFNLPTPGEHLPSVKVTGKNKVIKVENENDDSLSMDTIAEEDKHYVIPTNFAIHVMSYNVSHTEQYLKVQRPRLHYTRLDPDYYLPTVDALEEEKSFFSNVLSKNSATPADISKPSDELEDFLENKD